MKTTWFFACFMLILAGLTTCQEAPTPTATTGSSVSTAPPGSTGGSGTDCVSPGAGYPADSAASGYPAPGGDCLAAGYPGVQVIPAQPVAAEWHAEVLPPQPGLATVTGVVIHQKSQKPVINVPVFLAEVYRQGDSGAFVLDGAHSPQSVTDSDGRFAVVDIPAGDYVLVIGNPEVNDYDIIEDNNGKAQVWTADADNILDMAVIEVVLQLWQ